MLLGKLYCSNLVSTLILPEKGEWQTQHKFAQFTWRLYTPLWGHSTLPLEQCSAANSFALENASHSPCTHRDHVPSSLSGWHAILGSINTRKVTPSRLPVPVGRAIKPLGSATAALQYVPVWCHHCFHNIAGASHRKLCERSKSMQRTHTHTQKKKASSTKSWNNSKQTTNALYAVH